MCMDFDPPEFWSERQIKRARKEHRCDECYRTISVGEPYWYAFARHSDGPYSGTTCRHCRVIANWLQRNCGGFVYSMMVEDFGNHAEGSIGMMRLIVGARRKWASFGDRTRLLPAPHDPRDME
jgi:hypothetical protein